MASTEDHLAEQIEEELRALREQGKSRAMDTLRSALGPQVVDAALAVQRPCYQPPCSKPRDTTLVAESVVNSFNRLYMELRQRVQREADDQGHMAGNL